jgi:signal transduction histidine kinase
MLYVGNVDLLPEQEIELVQALAEAFSTAYARYQDFIRLEEAKQQVERTLSELKATQNQLIQKEKMASLGELTAGIAHEIQNPLNFVNNFAEVSVEMADELQESVERGDTANVTELSAELRENMTYIVENGKRAASIVRSMLEHSRSSTGERRLTNLNELADEYLKLAYHGMRAKDPDFQVQLYTEFDEELKPITVAPQDIGRVLLNLYNNAFYACGRSSGRHRER